MEWDDVNKLLQHHGFKPVQFADPVENKSLSDLVLLNKRTAAEIRTTLRVMLTDSERRQQLIQELIKSNNQLKEDVQSHMSRSLHQSQRVLELEGLLDEVRVKVQELEDRCLGKAVQQHGQMQQLQQEKQDAQKLCQTLEQKLINQKAETAQLQKKLYFAVKEEEQRLVRQHQTFEQICKKSVRQSSAADQQVLDVIDFYETKMSTFLDEFRRVKGETKTSQEDDETKSTKSLDSPAFKSLLKAFQGQQEDSKTQIEELKKKVEQLKQELETRPTLKDVKFYKHKLRRLEKLNNLRLSKDENFSEVLETQPSHSASESALCAQYLQLLSEISAVVTSPNAPLRLHRQKPVPNSVTVFQPLIPTLELWAQQLHLLRDLQQSLNKLSSRLLPWQPSEGGTTSTEPVKVEDMMLLVDMLLENTSTDDEKVLRSPTRHTLDSMVSHFQKLFDVSSLSGVYPRMNEVYSRLGEMTNTMRNLRDVLDLDSRVPPAEVVNAVARLASSQHTGVHDLLLERDIDSIIMKVKEHEEFFPAFHSLIIDILHTLGVSRLDDILPTLNSLKQKARVFSCG